jgi:hypothetical protein
MTDLSSHNIPDWLVTAETYPRSRAVIELRHMLFDQFFEHAIDDVAAGRPLRALLREDRRGFKYGEFIRWIMMNPERKRRYRLAQEIGAESVADELIDIADGTVPEGTAQPEDVARSKLRIETRQWMLKTWNRGRYADTKTVDVNVSNVTEEKIRQLSSADLKKMIIEGTCMNIEDAVLLPSSEKAE